MFILDTHKHSLIFRIDRDAPKNYMKRWNKIKFDCIIGNNEYIIEKIKTFCKLEKNRNIPYLQREEGGIGGNNNINKQIRFLRFYSKTMHPNYNNKDIVLDQIYNIDIEKWSYEELDDLIYAFIKTFNYFVEEKCVNGFIEMSNKKCLNSDDELE